MVISFATFLFFGDEYVRFGILHFLGTSMILFPILKKLNEIALWILATVIVVISGWVESTLVPFSVLLPIGFRYQGFATVDYYPLVPYLSVFILGILAYKGFYYKRMSIFPFYFSNRTVRFLSKHSLIIYLLHQPILIAIIYGLKFWLQ